MKNSESGEFFVTLDIDWAPDYVIDHVAQQLIDVGVRATWFVTHASPAVDRLRKSGDQFELGIHPNFLPGSTHGTTPESVLSHVTSLVPDAVSLRTHSVVQSGTLTRLIAEETQIQIDSSYFLPHMPQLRPIPYECAGRVLCRLPFFWADDYELALAQSNWGVDRLAHVPGHKVMLFHPIHVYLNSFDSQGYDAAKRQVSHLANASPSLLNQYVQKGEGTGQFFGALLQLLTRQATSRRLCDLVDERATRQPSGAAA